MVSIGPRRPGFALPRGDAVLLCEANVSADDVPKYCAAATGGPNDRCAGWTQDRWSSPWPRWPKLPAMAQWATFLRNHDELDLSKLTDEQRSDVMAAFAPKADMRIYDRGIRRRLASMMKGERRRIELAYSLQFTMPGTPILRYGEEIGMGEDLSLPGRESIRTPMQWEPGRSAGFSSAPPAQLVRPVLSRGSYSAKRVNVRAQRPDRDSLLRWFEELIRVLRECPEIGVGRPSVLDVALPRSVLAHRCDAPEGSILLLHNLVDRPVALDLSAAGGSEQPYEVFSDAEYEPLPRRLTQLRLNGWGYRWIRLRRGD